MAGRGLTQRACGCAGRGGPHLRERGLERDRGGVRGCQSYPSGPGRRRSQYFHRPVYGTGSRRRHAVGLRHPAGAGAGISRWPGPSFEAYTELGVGT